MSIFLRRESWLAVTFVLGACQSLSEPVVSQPKPRPLTQAKAEELWNIPVDVDPLHGAAFERSTDVDGLRPLVAFPDVSHDLSTGLTKVTLSITHAGAGPANISLEVDSPRALHGSKEQVRLGVVEPGGSRTLPLYFENPNAGGFSLNLALRSNQAMTGVAQRFALKQQAISHVATASDSYGTLEAERAVDGNLSSQWANADYRAPSAWLAIDTGKQRPMSELHVKMRPFSGGASYRIEVSNDGTTWRGVSGPLRNTTWQTETKVFANATEARHVRVVFTNDPLAPESRFSVFELGSNFEPLTTAPSSAPTVAPTTTPSPSPLPSSTPSPAPTNTPVPSGNWVRNFASDGLGSDPSDFIDPLDEGYVYPWMPRVSWQVMNVNGSRQYVHDGLANMAFLSFRRWRGSALGRSDGRLPDRYFTELNVTPLRSYTYAPTGDQGTQVYYLDPLNYLEVLIKPQYFEVWSATNAAPFQSRGWSRLFWEPLQTVAGQTRRLGADVDAARGQMRVFVDGVERATVTSPVLTTRPHWYALRGAGNIVAHDNIRIESR
ncbi:MAG: discoidin domain-containing protein [Candidatus Sericytochromatia bacterium]|nr:discoidin domain-containing protein [Candidatus Sericytochromatia bacterium]